MKRRSALQLFVSIILLFVRTFCVNLTVFNRFKAFCRPVGKGALRATFPPGSLKQQDQFIMNASSLMNINTDKKSIKKRVLWVVSISFVDLCCLVRQTQFFPILTLTTSSPSVTVFYRTKQNFRCTLSKILDSR